MTSAPPFDDDPDTEPLRKLGSGERKRAALVLAVLAVAAIVLVGVLYAVSTSSGGGDSGSPTNNAIPTGPAVKVTGVPSQSASSTSAKPKPSQSSSKIVPSSSARTGPVSCPTSAPCALPDDIGDAVKALNDYRAANGQKAVTGTVTKRAKTCAVGSGDTGSCPSGYYWEPVGRSGDQVIQKIATSAKGKAFLLDKSLTAIEVGWAYIPSSHSYECVLVGPS
jgi:hypothetical protein